MFLGELTEVWWPWSFAAVGVVFDVVWEFRWIGGDGGSAAEEGGEEGGRHAGSR